MKKRRKALSRISKGSDPAWLHHEQGLTPFSFLKDNSFTPFEKKVYKAVSRIPSGETRTYKWMAAKAGRPRAARAVGNALHKNPYPVAIPCHRVVRSDGSIGGFSRGAAAKRKLLRSEGVRPILALGRK